MCGRGRAREMAEEVVSRGINWFGAWKILGDREYIRNGRCRSFLIIIVTQIRNLLSGVSVSDRPKW
jgi:hypothetical protein